MPSISYLIDLKNGQIFHFGANWKKMASWKIGKSQAIKKVNICIQYSGLLRLVLSLQWLIDYMSNESRGCTVDV